MGSFGAGLASIGGSVAKAQELQRQQQLEDIKIALEKQRLGTEEANAATQREYAKIAGKRLEIEESDLQTRLREANLPQFKGFHTEGNTMLALTRDPKTGAMSVSRFPINEQADQLFAGAAQNLISTVSDPVRRQRLNDLWGLHSSMGDYKGGFTALQSEIGRSETADAADERQKRSQKFQREQQARSFAEREKLSATIYNAGKNAVAIDSAIKAVNTILANGTLLNDLFKASKIELTIDPQGTMQSLVARNIKLSPAEARVATAFAALTEHINLLRGPLGAQGFRGPEAFARLQAQRGNALANPAITIGVLNYTLENFVKMQRVNERILTSPAMQSIIAPIESEGTLDLQPE